MKRKSKAGRKPKPKGTKILPNGLDPKQWEKIQTEAKRLGLDDGAKALRKIVDWYFEEQEQHNSGTVATPADDKAFEELLKEQQTKSKSKN